MSVPQPLTLTFAELEFVLLACPQQAARLRTRLRLSPAGRSVGAAPDGDSVDEGEAGNSGNAGEPGGGDRDMGNVAAAGLASLLVRGLCEAGATQNGTDVVPGPEVAALAAAFVSARCHATAAGWRGRQADVMYVFDSSSVRVALFPFQYGRYEVRFLDPAEPLSAPLSRYLDAHLAPGETSVFVAEATAGAVSVAATATVDASGAWFASDSLFRPGAVASASREAFHARLVDLFDRELRADGSTADVAGSESVAGAGADIGVSAATMTSAR